MPYFSLLKKKECLSLTWRAWLLILISLAFLGVFILSQIHTYLAISNTVTTEVLIIEGWIPDVSLEKAVRLIEQGQYDVILTSGGPLVRGSHLSEYSSYADLSAATLKKMGIYNARVFSVPSGQTDFDRTLASALAIKSWLSEQEMLLNSVDVFTLGVHARRTQLLFQKTLGSSIKVGVISSPHPDYDPTVWWKSSAGIKAVLSESIALLYTKIAL